MRPLFIPRRRRVPAIVVTLVQAVVTVAACVAIGAMLAQGFRP